MIGKVQSLSRPVAAMLLLLVALASTASVCEGWRASAEARMACCEDETNCPMHAAKPHGQTTRPRVTQLDADTCCASAQSSASTTAPWAYAPIITLALLASPISVVGPDVAASFVGTASRSPLAPSPVHGAKR